MSRSSRSRIVIIGFGAFVVAVVMAFALWYWSSGETSTVLAALTEPTATPVPRPTLTGDEKTARKEKKRQVLAEIATGAFGTIERTSGDLVTLRDPQGTSRTLAIQGKTQLVIVGKPEATVADLTIGSRVLALGAKAKKGNQEVLVSRILVSAPAAYNETNVMLGRLVTGAGSTWELTTANGPKTITLASSAQIVDSGFGAARPAALEPESNVLVLGEPLGADTFQAQVAVNLPRARPFAALTKAERKAAKQAVKQERKSAKKAGKTSGKRNQAKDKAAKLARGFGKVAAISPTELELDTAPRGAKTYILDPNTKLAVVRTPDATTADIQIGDTALVRGGKRKPAKFLFAAPSNYTLENVAAGKIVEVGNGTLVLKNKLRELTLTLSNDTQIMDRAGNPLSLSDLTEKSSVLVIGIPNGSNELQAQILFVQKQK